MTITSTLNKVLIGVLILSFVFGGYQCSIKNKYINSYTKLSNEVAAQDLLAKTNQTQAKEAETNTIIEYRDRVKIVKEKADVIEKQVTVYIPTDFPVIPYSFRLLHDSAVQSRTIAESEFGIDGAGTRLEDVASTVTENYEICNINAEKVRSWQAYYNRLCAIYGCK